MAGGARTKQAGEEARKNWWARCAVARCALPLGKCGLTKKKVAPSYGRVKNTKDVLRGVVEKKNRRNKENIYLCRFELEREKEKYPSGRLVRLEREDEVPVVSRCCVFFAEENIVCRFEGGCRDQRQWSRVLLRKYKRRCAGSRCSAEKVAVCLVVVG